MEQDSAEKRRRGRPAMGLDEKRVIEKISLPFDQAAAARNCARSNGQTLSQFVECALKEAIYKDTLSKSARIDPSNFISQDPSEFVAQFPDPEKKYWIDLCGGVAAGSQIATDAASEPIATSKAHGDDCYALRVFGRSMEPKIKDGSIIIVRKLREGTSPRKESIVVYSDAYGLSLKQLAYRKAKADEDANALGKVAVLKSLNPEFPEIQTMDGGRIEAVFVESI